MDNGYDKTFFAPLGAQAVTIFIRSSGSIVCLEIFNYSGKVPTPTPYFIFTLMTLRETFTAGAVLLTVHYLVILLVKVLNIGQVQAQRN